MKSKVNVEPRRMVWLAESCDGANETFDILLAQFSAKHIYDSMKKLYKD